MSAGQYTGNRIDWPFQFHILFAFLFESKQNEFSEIVGSKTLNQSEISTARRGSKIKLNFTLFLFS